MLPKQQHQHYGQQQQQEQKQRFWYFLPYLSHLKSDFDGIKGKIGQPFVLFLYFFFVSELLLIFPSWSQTLLEIGRVQIY